MLHQPTVFVLGAGSSYEAGLPVGGTLAGNIADLFNYNREDYGRRAPSAKPIIVDAIMHYLKTNPPNSAVRPNFFSQDDLQPYINAGRFLQQGIILANSIDDFLDLHSGDPHLQLIGRLAIAHEIQAAEQRSTLVQAKGNDDIEFHSIADTFYVKLFKILSRGVSANAPGKLFENTTFITFNYDRTLEHFLVRALIRLYKLSIQAASEIVSSVKIWHPYGIVGSLPYFEGGNQHSRFGSMSDAAELLTISAGIKTYTEQVLDTAAVDRARDAIAAARSLVFLGFGFHEQNLSLLKPAMVSYHKHIYATAYLVSGPNCDVIRDILHGFLPDQQPTEDKSRFITLRPDLTCTKLLDEYALPLTKR